MLKPEQIPNEVRAVLQKACDSGEPWDIADTLAAAINAWPEMTERFFPNDPTRPPGIFLPLPKETEA